MQYAVIIFYLLVFLFITYSINKRNIIELPVYTLPVLFIIKIGFAGLFIYIYTYHYGNGVLSEDAGNFFHDSKILRGIFTESPQDFFRIFFGTDDRELIDRYMIDSRLWQNPQATLINDARSVVRVNTIFQFFSGGFVFVHFIFLSFASFVGGVDLFQWLKKKSNFPPLLLIVLLICIPSIAFWGASIIKEPLMFLGLSLFLRGFFDDISIKRKAWRIILGVCLTFFFKPYIFTFLVIITIYYFTFSRLFRKQWINYLIFGIVGLGLLWVSAYSNNVTQKISNKQKDFINVRDGGMYLGADETHYYHITLQGEENFLVDFDNGTAVLQKPVVGYYLLKTEKYERTPVLLDDIGNEYQIFLYFPGANSKIDVTLIDNDFGVLLATIPEALFNGLLQPIPNKESAKIEYLSLLENLFFLFGVILLLIFPKMISFNDSRAVFSMLLFAVFIALLVGWTTPIAGAITRYNVPAKIVIIVVFALKIDYRKVINCFSDSKTKVH